MVTLSIEEEEEAEEEGNDLNERPFERESNGGFGRGFSHGNGRGNRKGFHPHATSERDQRDRQEEEWSIPVSVGGRGETFW